MNLRQLKKLVQETVREEQLKTKRAKSRNWSKLVESATKRVLLEAEGDVIVDINDGPEAILAAAEGLADPKSVFNQAADENEKITFTTGITLKPTELTPTQKEIGTNKSLNDQCTNQYGALQKVIDGGLLGPDGGSPVLIFQGGGGNFVLDGHHRWSQFAAVRPDDSCVQCSAISAPGIDTPEAALAMCHAIILAMHGDSPTKDWSGKNLLDMEEPECTALAKELIETGDGAGSNGNVLEMVIAAKILPEGSTMDDYAAHLGKNCANMPGPAANDGKGYTRSSMPQMADAGVDVTSATGGQPVISKGEVEYGPGEIKESFDLDRWNKLAGILKD